jgi:hypothetical protein
MIYYYGALDCVTSQNTSFSSSRRIDVPQPCTLGNSNCVLGYGGPHRASYDLDVIPHYVEGAPSLSTPLASSASFDDCKCKTHVAYQLDCVAKLSDSEKYPVRLMLLVMVPDGAGRHGPRYYLPIGQQIEAPSGGEMAGVPVTPYYCTVMNGPIKHHVILVDYTKAKKK